MMLCFRLPKILLVESGSRFYCLIWISAEQLEFLTQEMQNFW
jgi:hypothetical protein